MLDNSLDFLTNGEDENHEKIVRLRDTFLLHDYVCDVLARFTLVNGKGQV